MNYAMLIQPVLWAATLGTCVAFLGRAAWCRRKKKPAKGSFRLVLAALVAAFLVVPSIGVVPGGYRGVVYQWNGGISSKARGEGVTFIVPWFQHLTTMTVRTQKVYSAKVYAQSADLQEITVVASVNYHVEPAKAPHLYQAVGLQYGVTVIQPALYQRTKAAIGQIKAEAFALNRDKLARTIEAQLKTQLSGYGIVVEYVNIEDAIFDPAFVKAVKDKIIAIQQAKEQRNLVAAKRAMKTQTIVNAQANAAKIKIEATAQAQANRKIEASLTGDLLRWRWILTWNGTLPSTLVGGNPQLLLGLGSSGSGYVPQGYGG